eukprot:scaffold183055_cov11-Prasinocladus_malaysianus.AAC.1
MTADHVNAKRSNCTFTLVEVGSCAELRLFAKRAETTAKYEPLIMTNLRELWKDAALVVVVP